MIVNFHRGNMTIIIDLINAAKQVYPDNIILRNICIIQGIHESNLLRKPSSLATKYYNLFGIKKAGTAGVVYLTTKEEINGKLVTMAGKDAQKFGVNKSILDSVKQHSQIMDLPRYTAVKKARTFEEAAKALVTGGYATDSRYAYKLIDIYNSIKTQYNLT